MEPGAPRNVAFCPWSSVGPISYYDARIRFRGVSRYHRFFYVQSSIWSAMIISYRPEASDRAVGGATVGALHRCYWSFKRWCRADVAWILFPGCRTGQVRLILRYVCGNAKHYFLGGIMWNYEVQRLSIGTCPDLMFLASESTTKRLLYYLCPPS